MDQFKIARELYLQCVDEDPRYAPAWARLGRCYRLIGKAGEDVEENFAEAESCFKRALQLNPELAMAHNLYAQLETDLGRSRDALVRLTARAVANTSDPEVFAGLVLVCRYCALLDASVAAHERARRLDPHIPTSVRHTYWLLGDNPGALAGGGRFFFEGMVLASMGQTSEAIALLLECEQVDRPEMMRTFLSSLRLLLQGKREESVRATERCIGHFRDPEALFYLVRQLAYLGESTRALTELRRVLDLGYVCTRALSSDPWLDGLRSHEEFRALLERAVSLEREMADVFLQSGADRLLGVSA